MRLRAQPALIEIVERRPQGYDESAEGVGEHVIRPDEVRINGSPLLTRSDRQITIHETVIGSDDFVQVTLTLFARRVVIAPESADEDEA